MSANLLAELEDFYQPSSKQLTSQHQLPQQISTVSSVAAPVNQPQEDDDFGDFETATPAPTTPSRPPTQPSEKSPTSSTKDKPLPARPKPELPIQKPLPKPRNLDVLFDAEEDSGDDEVDVDDFGDFEGGFSPPPSASIPRATAPVIAPKAAPQNPPKLQSLIDFDDDPPYDPPPVKTPSVPRRQDFNVINPDPAPAKPVPRPANNDFEDLLGLDAPVESIPAKKPPQLPVQQEAEEEAEWDDFETAQSPVSSPNAVNAPSVEPLALSQLMQASIPADNELPPTNIPPPAILLTIFPSIVAQGQAELFGPLSQYNDRPHIRDELLQPLQTRQYLSDMIECGVVLARIIAGRKNRWKRDKILAQSMSIGQAGRSGGMKLAGVDKAENAREEREAADAVASWQSQLGKLKTAINTAGRLGAVPDVSESYIVRLAPASEGAINSPKACIICGLKRNERVAKIDVDVQDSFGEWWIEHFGHKQCVRLWYAQKDALKSR